MNRWPWDVWEALGAAPVDRWAAYTPTLLRIERAADLVTALAYFTFPLAGLGLARRLGVTRFPCLILLTCSFVLFCGFDHVLRVVSDYDPSWLSAASGIGVATAVVSWAAVGAAAWAYRGLTTPTEAVVTASVGANAFSKTYLTIALTTAAAVLAGGAGYQSLSGLVTLAADRRRDAAAEWALVRLTVVLNELESGQCAYLVTDDAAALRHYRKAADRLPQLLDDTAAKGTVWKPHDLVQLLATARGRAAFSERVVELAAGGDRRAAVGLARTGTGMNAMARFHGRVGYLIGVLEARSSVRLARLERSGTVALVTIPAVAAAAPVLIAGAAWGAARERRRRLLAEAKAAFAMDQSRRDSQLLNTLSHDLRTPLNAIVQSTYLAEALAVKGVEDPDRFIAALGEVRKAAKAQANLLEGFLELERAERGEPNVVAFPVRPLLAEIADLTRIETRRKGVAVHVTATPHNVTARTDPNLLKRAVLNLASNAAKFTTSGSITLAASRPRPGWTAVAVADTGPGVPADFRDKLFAEFSQAGNPERDSTKGFGLGLAIVRRTAASLQGSVRLESTSAAGSTFVIEVPDLPTP